MKKYIYLFSVTIIIIAALVMPGYISDNRIPEIEVLKAAEKNMDNTVSANGRLQYKSARNVRTDNAGIIESISVKNGEKVKKDELLFSYYRLDDAYSALISQYQGAEGIEAIISSFSGQIDSSSLLEEAKKYCTLENVYSEYEGTITDISLEPDDIAEKNSTVLKISDQQILEVPVNINEAYIEEIEIGQEAVISFNALPDESFKGKVTKIADEADQTSGLTGKETTVEVTITLDDNENNRLRVGYSASCSIITSTDENVLVLPYEVIRTDDEGDYVFIAENGKIKKVRIKTGTEYKDGVQIISGLHKNELAVTGSEDFYDGQKIKIKQQTGNTDD